MIVAPKPENEIERISSLYEYGILDSMPEKEYDDITRIAANICGMPIAIISLIDNDRQWFKSKVGIDDNETHRDLSFCAHAILTPEDVFTVPNAATDERFFDNPFVTGAPFVGFYAGVPLVNETGNPLGTLCILDNKPNVLAPAQKEALKALARQVVANFEIKRKNQQLANYKREMEELNNDLTQFAYVVAHDMKSPCNSLAMSAKMLKEMYGETMDEQGVQFLSLMEETSHAAVKMVEGILEHTRTVHGNEIIREHFKFGNLIDELKKLVKVPEEFTLMATGTELAIYTSRSILLQVMLNLVNNAIKYNDKNRGEIMLAAEDTTVSYKFSVSDNGPGIKASDRERIFELLKTLGVTDRYNNKGTGIGLATVKKLVEKLNGSISVESEVGIGSTFIFTIGK